jgi:gluconolactonase
MKRKIIIASLMGLAVIVTSTGCYNGMFSDPGVVAEGAKPVEIGGGCKFTEGPVRDSDGGVFFTDDGNKRIMKWFTDGRVEVFRENVNRPSGMALDHDGNLLVGEKGNHSLTKLFRNGERKTLIQKYNGKLLNEPNDVWVRPNGGIYFSDPYYGPKGEMPQDGKHVYYLNPAKDKLIRVTTKVVHPNGIIGTPDDKFLYVADNRGEVRTWKFKINDDGTLSDQTLFVEQGADGVCMDKRGNIYLCMDKIYVYSKKGVLIDTIEMPNRPGNLCFFGEDNDKLFICAGPSVYSLQMNVKGMY